MAYVVYLVVTVISVIISLFSNDSATAMSTSKFRMKVWRIRIFVQGRIQDFHLEGAQRLCALTHITSAKSEVPYTAGVQCPLKGP